MPPLPPRAQDAVPPAVSLGDRPTDPARLFRVLGVVTIASTPITGFISFAIVAIIVGETRLEGPDGLTALGGAALALPALLGAVLLLWSRRATTLPDRRSFGLLTAGSSMAFAGIGFYSTTSSAADGDASIGGGLLVIVSLPLAVAALVLLWPTIRSMIRRPSVD